jgi:hypothetical protein
MWKSTDVEDALPAIISVAGTTCLRSKNADVLAATDTLPKKSIPLIVIDAVAADAVGLQITIFVTTAVVAEGVVYRVVLDVAAAVLASTLVVVAISYYLSFVSMNPLCLL